MFHKGILDRNEQLCKLVDRTVVFQLYRGWGINSTVIKNLNISSLVLSDRLIFLVSGKTLFKIVFHAVNANRYFC